MCVPSLLLVGMGYAVCHILPRVSHPWGTKTNSLQRGCRCLFPDIPPYHYSVPCTLHQKSPATLLPTPTCISTSQMCAKFGCAKESETPDCRKTIAFYLACRVHDSSDKSAFAPVCLGADSGPAPEHDPGNRHRLERNWAIELPTVGLG